MSSEFLISKIKKNNFLLIGRAGIDIYPEPPGTKTENAKTFVSHLGGSSANTAVELVKFGGKCQILTRVSDDALGRFVLNQLEYYGVNHNLVKYEKNESRISFAIVESRLKDHQSIIYRHMASDLFMNKSDIDNGEINKFDCILLTGTSFAAEPSRSAVFYALEKANEMNIPVIMDIDYRPYTWESQSIASEIYNLAVNMCTGVIGNDDEFSILAGSYNDGLSYAKELANKTTLVIYKKGQNGSVTFFNDNEINKGIFPVKALKPTGAGDAFMGAFIGSILNKYDINEALDIASAAAAIVVTKVGCAPAMPNLNEILEFMKYNKIS